MRKTASLMMVIVIFASMLFQGCKKARENDIPELSQESSATSETDEAYKALEEITDLQVLDFYNASEGAYSTTYRYVFEPEDIDYLGDDIKMVYDTANEILSQSKDSDVKIEITIGYDNDLPDIGYVCLMKNYSDNTDSEANNYISDIGVLGIDDEFPGYDKYTNYEINDMDFWGYFADSDVSFPGRIIYENERMNSGSEVEDIAEYLKADFGEYLNVGDPYTYQNAVWICWNVLPITFDQDKIDSTCEYASTIELVEAVRHKMNEYWKENPDSTLLNNRLEVDFVSDNDVAWGSFKNYLYSGDWALLEEFSAVDYPNATPEEIADCTGIIEVDVKFWELDDVKMIAENMTDLKYTAGILYVSGISGFDDEDYIELSEEYSDIEFN